MKSETESPSDKYFLSSFQWNLLHFGYQVSCLGLLAVTCHLMVVSIDLFYMDSFD